MIYLLHELQKQILEPILNLSESTYKLLTNPISPFSHIPYAQRIAAGYELFYRIGKEYKKPTFSINETIVSGQQIQIQESIVLENDFCNLLQFKKILKPNQNIPKQQRILIVAPLSGHHATLLRDTVQELLKNNDVYITDWLDAKDIPIEKGPFHLSDYVSYVQKYIQFFGSEIHVIAICQPTVPVLAAISLLASSGDTQPATLILMGGPIDGRINPTEVNKFAQEKDISWFRETLIDSVPCNYIGRGRKVYPGFLQHAAFIAMNPEHHAKSHQEFYNNLSINNTVLADMHRKFYDEYNAVIDMPADYYLETIESVFQQFELAKGIWEVNGKIVNPKDITKVALFTIEGEKDDICGLGQTFAAQKLCPNIEQKNCEHFVVPDAGHFGIFSGKKWREIVAPKVSQFIEKHKNTTE
jgi:poly(3-hydroxybutyrate) depolymerase